MKNVDNAGDEHGAAAARVHAGSLAFMSKPVTHGRPKQELLYWGSMGGVSSTAADWQDGRAFGNDAIDYEPLFAQLRGKRWAGEAHAVRVQSGGPAQANLFVIEPSKQERDACEAARAAGAEVVEPTMPRVLVIALAPANGTVTVELRGPVEYRAVTVHHPGIAGVVSAPLTLVAPKTENGVTQLAVPISAASLGPTGVAVVRLTPK